MATAILVMFAISATIDAGAADDIATPSAIVRLDNLALVPADYLAFAEGRAGDVFGRIGVHVTWIDEETAARDHIRPPFTVVLIKSGPELSVREGIVDALGFADPSVSRAHSSRGIMRSGVDVHAHPLETFTSPQARQIVFRLTQRR